MDEPDDTLDDPATRRLTPQQRLVRVINIILVLALALNVFNGRAATLLHRVTRALGPQPVPPPTHLYVDLDVPWLTVAVDGRPQRIYAVGTGIALTLPRGRHVITWTGAPFLPQSCQLSVPDAAADTCAPLLEGALPLPGGGSASVLHAGEWFATVQPAARRTLFDAIQTALDDHDGTDTIQPGEGYALERHGVVTAAAPLHAQLSFQLEADLTGTLDPTCRPDASHPASYYCLAIAPYCQRLCALPWPLRGWGPNLQPAPEWLALAAYHSTWRYSTVDGRFAGEDTVDDPRGAAIGGQYALLRITWDASGWHARAFFGADLPVPLVLAQHNLVDDPTCYTAEGIIGDSESVNERASYTEIRAVTGSNLAIGCAIVADVAPSTNDSAPPAALAIYFYRFGILMSASVLAHRLRPNLPLASPAERQLALQLAALPGRVIFRA
jgi:hypothetical protein